MPIISRLWKDKEQISQERTFSLILAIVGIFFLSLFMSCQELRYMVSGKTVDAGAALRDDTKEVNGSHVPIKALTYHYVDGQTPRESTIEVPLDYQVAGTVKVQYIPGRDISRLQGQSNKVWVCIFFGSIVLAIIGGWILVRST